MSGRGASPAANALVDRYAGIVFDLDGVVLHDRDPLPGALETVTVLRQRDVAFAFVTNNASRTPEEIAALLTAAGVPAESRQVVTSALAAAALIEPGTRCLVVGDEGLRAALAARDCVLVREPDDAEAVVVGWNRSLVWDDLRRATLALALGARFIASNTDAAYPSAEGPWPGNGAIVAALERASGRTPEVAGKPHAALFTTAAAMLPRGPLLMVGDRHDTDIVGAACCGWDTALVLSGITAREAVEGLRPPPTWILEDIRGLLQPPPAAASPPHATGLVIREASQDDVDAVLRLWDEAGMLAYTPEPERDMAAVLRHDPGLFLVAELDGKVVGVLLGTSDGRRGWLQRVAVATEHRRSGIGRALVVAVEARLAVRGIARINLLHMPDNDAAATFWDGLGYGPGWPAVLRSKALGRADGPARC